MTETRLSGLLIKTGSIPTNAIQNFSGTVTASLPSGTVSSSAQVTSLLPTGTVSSSAQINTYLDLDGVYSSSTQVVASLPTGTVSASTQYPGWVTSSTQINYTQLQNIPTGIVSSSGQITLSGIAGTTFANSTFAFPSDVGITGNLTVTGSITSSYVTTVNAGNYLGFYADSTASVTFNSTVRSVGDIVAFYSDARLKNFISPIPNALEKVNKLTGYYFTENTLAKSLGLNNDQIQVGVSAQDVLEVLPEIVVPAPIDATYYTVKYEKIIPLLIEAIKEQQRTIQTLEARIETLEQS